MILIKTSSDLDNVFIRCVKHDEYSNSVFKGRHKIIQ